MTAAAGAWAAVFFFARGAAVGDAGLSSVSVSEKEGGLVTLTSPVFF